MSHERGSVLVEFALVSLVLYLLLAAAIDFGRLMFSAQAAQDAVRVAAREIAITPFPAACPSLHAALTNDVACLDSTTGTSLMDRIFNPACLIVDLSAFGTKSDDINAGVEAFFRDAPLLNKALRPLMFFDIQGDVKFLRYPGRLVPLPEGAASPHCADRAPLSYIIDIPSVTLDPADGHEVIQFLDVLEEMLNAGGESQFSVASQGLVALRLNYPYQAGAMIAYKPMPPSATDPLPPNAAHPIETTEDVGDPPVVGPYTGPQGLGRQLAYAGKTVRPFRKLLSAQAIYRREVFQ